MRATYLLCELRHVICCVSSALKRAAEHSSKRGGAPKAQRPGKECS